MSEMSLLSLFAPADGRCAMLEAGRLAGRGNKGNGAPRGRMKGPAGRTDPQSCRNVPYRRPPGADAHLKPGENMPMLDRNAFALRFCRTVYVIAILAFVAGFLALRLYSVLGKRTGHEQQPAPSQADDRPKVTVLQPKPAAEIGGEAPRIADGLIVPGAEAGIRALIAADRQFDVPQFVEGAKSAYRMVLEAFWRGDRQELAWLCDADVLSSFNEALDAREAEGQVLENRLVRIDKAQIVGAALNGRIALVEMRFDADIAAITRDRDGHVIAGSLTDAVSTHDIWTFSRDIRSNDPNWKLAETDEAA
jgi:predicted lipid-binding transport protein (Tim44 family)